MEGDADVIENGDFNFDNKLAENGILNNNVKEVNGFGEKNGKVEDMDKVGLVNTALDKIGDYGSDEFSEAEAALSRKAYSNPELRALEELGRQQAGYAPGEDGDGPRELTEDEYQEFLEDSECLVENGGVEPGVENGETEQEHDEPEALDVEDLENGEPDFDPDEPHGDVMEDEPIEEINEMGQKKLAVNLGDISPIDEFPPLGGGFPGMSDEHTLGDPDWLSGGSDMDEPREGSPEPCDRRPLHLQGTPEYPHHPAPHSSDEDEELMPADTADSVENILNDSVEREAVAQLRNQPKAQEDEEDNFVLTAMCDAVEAGDLGGMKELLDTANHYDVNLTNKHGETVLLMACGAGQLEIVEYLHSKGANLNVLDKNGDNAVYWAARQGHVDIIRFLKDQAVTIDMQNNAGEAPIHVAARYGHNTVIDYLCSVDADVNLQDKLLETPLHNACWHGMPAQTCLRLCGAGARVDAINKEGETPLHCAAARGNLDCVRVLLDNTAPINATDRRGSTALHMACRRHHVAIALVLLHHGCQFDVVDHLNETPLHIAAKEGILPIVQTLCAFGCKLEMLSRGGMTPLHLAAKGGHLEVVRCLLLSGAEPDLPNKDGISAEIMALAQGHNDIAELLTRLKPEKRELYMKQLMPTSNALSRVKIKLFGHSGSGKSTLADSLKCGYFGSFFRKARLSTSSSVAQDPSAKSNGHAELENGVLRHNSLPSQLSYDVKNHSYTHGIDVHNVTLTGSGDVSIWDFSGYEPYYMLYDHFIGDPNAIHVVTFSLAEAHATQLAQVLFWMNFLKARIPPFEPIGPNGKHPWPARVLLVATHADKANCAKNNKGEFVSDQASLVLATVLEKFALDFDISQHVLVVDAHLAMSSDLKAMRTMLGEIKNDILQVELQHLPCSNGFLDSVITALPAWRKSTANFPVLPWPSFIELVRSKVNMLASEEHMKELIQQLQILGEVIYLETAEEHDLVVLDGKWLGMDVIGHLLSHDNILNARPTGCFTVDDFQLIFPDAEAKDILQILEALEVCTKCENDGEVEYEFPCLNFVERLHGLWEKDIKRYPNAVYGGVRIQCPRAVPSQMSYLIPRIQTALRRHMISEHNSPDNDLYQWHHGSKYCSGYLESLVTLEQDDMVIEVKARGPQDMRTNLFYFFEDVCQVVTQVIDDSCPGMDYEKHILSPAHLKDHAEAPHSYAPSTLLRSQLNGETSLKPEDASEEHFTDIVSFGSDEIKEFLCVGIDLHISHLSLHTRRNISTLLDPPDPMGRDWCLLAVSLGLTETLPSLDEASKKRIDSRTDRSLEEWSRDSKATMLTLISKLRELGREDAVDLVLQNSPTYKVFPDQDASREESPTGAVAPSHSSNNTLSSVSR